MYIGLCVLVCSFSSSICQCKISLPCINAKRVVPVEVQLIALSCPQFFPSLPLHHPSKQAKNWSIMKTKWSFFFPSFLPSPLLHILQLFPLHLLLLLTPLRPQLDEVLLLVLCSRVASLCIDDGCVSVRGVIWALGFVGQIRSCGGEERKGGQKKQEREERERKREERLDCCGDKSQTLEQQDRDWYEEWRGKMLQYDVKMITWGVFSNFLCFVVACNVLEILNFLNNNQ